MAALRVDGVASVPLPAFPGGARPASSPLLDAAGARADGRCAEEFRRTCECFFEVLGDERAGALCVCVYLLYGCGLGAREGARARGHAGDRDATNPPA